MTLRRATPFWAKKKVGGGGLPYTPPLDVFSNASAAYSVRKLRSAYTGPCMRIADSSDNQVDIGFDSNGLLDVSAIQSHVGTLGAAYVVKWYDQSGNSNDATAPISNSSRRTISNTSIGIIYINGLPATISDNTGLGGGAKTLTFSNKIDLGSLFFVGQRNVSGAIDTVFWDGPNTEGLFVGGSNSSVTGFGGYVSASFGPVNTTENLNQRLWEYIYSGGTSYVWTDGSNSASKVTAQISGNEMGRSTLNGGGANFTMAGYWQEFITFSDDKSSERTSIESNINSYFSIY